MANWDQHCHGRRHQDNAQRQQMQCGSNWEDQNSYENSDSEYHPMGGQEQQTNYRCNVCGCNVAMANWDQHCNGRRHQVNLVGATDDEPCDDDDDVCSDDDEATHFNEEETGYATECVPVDWIFYMQDAIAPRFSDGTSIEDGIDNVCAGHRYQQRIKAV